MSKISTLLDLPKYFDEAIDTILLFFKALKAFRQENPYFDIIGYILLGAFLVAIISMYINHRRNKSQDEAP